MALVGSRLVFGSRLVVGAALNNPRANMVGINDPFIDPELLAYIPIEEITGA